jgi:hypothetical protein
MQGNGGKSDWFMPYRCIYIYYGYTRFVQAAADRSNFMNAYGIRWRTFPVSLFLAPGHSRLARHPRAMPIHATSNGSPHPRSQSRAATLTGFQHPTACWMDPLPHRRWPAGIALRDILLYGICGGVLIVTAPSTPPSSPPLAGCPVQPEIARHLTSGCQRLTRKANMLYALCFTPNRPIPIGSATK